MVTPGLHLEIVHIGSVRKLHISKTSKSFVLLFLLFGLKSRKSNISNDIRARKGKKYSVSAQFYFSQVRLFF
jgi:hypothetical protein